MAGGWTAGPSMASPDNPVSGLARAGKTIFPYWPGFNEYYQALVEEGGSESRPDWPGVFGGPYDVDDVVPGVVWSDEERL